MNTQRMLTICCFAALLSACGAGDSARGEYAKGSTAVSAVALASSSGHTSVGSSQQTPTRLPLTARPTWQAALKTVQAQRTARAELTAQAQNQINPSTKPTEISAYRPNLPGGGHLDQNISDPVRHPWLVDAWSLELPDKRMLVVYAGGYIYPLDKYSGQELLKPELGAYSVAVYQPAKPGSPTHAPLDKSDPRNTNGTLPVRDGMARIVDALVTNDRIMVTLRTDGSAYTYEVNSGTLAPAQAPTVDVGGPYRVRAGAVLGLEAQGHDAAGMQFNYAWDLDGDGSFETKGQRAVFNAKALTGPQQRRVRVQVTARSGLSATAETTVAIDN